PLLPSPPVRSAPRSAAFSIAPISPVTSPQSSPPRTLRRASRLPIPISAPCCASPMRSAAPCAPPSAWQSKTRGGASSRRAPRNYVPSQSAQVTTRRNSATPISFSRTSTRSTWRRCGQFLTADEAIRPFFCVILLMVMRSQLVRSFTHAALSPDPDLAVAALMIARVEYPRLDAGPYLDQLDSYGSEARHRITSVSADAASTPAGIDPERYARVMVLNDYIFGELR